LLLKNVVNLLTFVIREPLEGKDIRVTNPEVSLLTRQEQLGKVVRLKRHAQESSQEALDGLAG